MKVNLEEKPPSRCMTVTSSSGPGNCSSLPKGVEHRPRADDVVEVLLIEPHGTVNTGDPESKLTTVKERI